MSPDLHYELAEAYRAGRDAAGPNRDRIEAGLAAVFARLAMLAVDIPEIGAQDTHTPRGATNALPGGTESGEGREGCSIGDRLRTEADDYDRAHNGESAFTATLRGLAHEADMLLTERDEWKRRRDAAVRECRFLHQDGLSRHDWHAKHCGAVEAADALRGQVERVRALADEWDRAADHRRIDDPDLADAYVSRARDLRDALEPSSKAAPDCSQAGGNGEAAVRHG